MIVIEIVNDHSFASCQVCKSEHDWSMDLGEVRKWIREHVEETGHTVVTTRTQVRKYGRETNDPS